MIIDAHVHLLPKRVREDRSYFCLSDPAFGSIYSSENTRLVSEDEIMSYLDSSGIERAIVFGFPWEAPDLVASNNDEVWSFHQRYPGRIIPFAVLTSAGHEAAFIEAARTLEGGFAGLGELAMYHGGWNSEDFEALDPVLKLAAENKVPVVLHVNEPVGHKYPGKITVDFSGLLSLIAANPDIDVVLAHFGGGVFIYALMPEIGIALSRTYVDTAASPFLYDRRVFDVACRLLGPGKILFGSDFPLLTMARYLKELDKAGIYGALREAILGHNAAKLLERKSQPGQEPATIREHI